MSVDLVPTPTATLAQCEAVIAHGLRTFVEVGDALLVIRDERLYRETHATFEDYCRDRWDLDKPYAHRLITASEVARVLVPNGTAPKTEAVARELAPLRAAPEQLREAWTEVVQQHGPAPTAAQVREVVKDHRPTPIDVHAEFAKRDPDVAKAVAVRDSNTIATVLLEISNAGPAGCPPAGTRQ